MRAFFSREIWSLASCSTMSSSLRRCSCSWDSSFCHRLPCTDATSWNSLQACPENQKINRFIIFKKIFNILYSVPETQKFMKNNPCTHSFICDYDCTNVYGQKHTHTQTHTQIVQYITKGWKTETRANNSQKLFTGPGPGNQSITSFHLLVPHDFHWSSKTSQPPMKDADEACF